MFAHNILHTQTRHWTTYLRPSPIGRRQVEMDDQKEEIENLRKQIKGLKISLMLTQISTVPIGMAIHNNKPAKSLSEGRITYIISPRKVWEVTGHVWKGKEAL